jgi:uncharacterized protein YehS (DUF1456 family)
MHNNEILSRLSDALSLTDARLVAIFELGGEALEAHDARALALDHDQDGAVVCSDQQLVRFLDGFIVEQRGPGRKAPVVAERLTNNAVLKKLRIALTLQEDHMLRILSEGGHGISNRALTTLFRKPGNKHYRTCGDEVLRSFLSGLKG